MDLKTLWLGWRRDIIRFVAGCLAAAAVGLLINRAKAGVHEGITQWLPRGSLDGLTADVDFDALAGPRRSGEPWTYRTRLRPGQAVAVHGLHGSIRVEPGHGEFLEVAAVKSFSSSDPESVHLVAVPTSGGVAVCALWGGAGDDGEGETQSRCGLGDTYKAGNAHDNDVDVQFTVRVPRGVRMRASTVTGSVRVAGATAPVIAGSVDGAVDAETMLGPLQAFSVNGSVRAAVHGFADTGAIKLATMNGSVTLELADGLDATVRANTINGSIASDFPLTTHDKVVMHHAAGTIGRGGRRVDLRAVNGAIRLKRIASPTPSSQPPIL